MVIAQSFLCAVHSAVLGLDGTHLLFFQLEAVVHELVVEVLPLAGVPQGVFVPGDVADVLAGENAAWLFVFDVFGITLFDSSSSHSGIQLPDAFARGVLFHILNIVFISTRFRILLVSGDRVELDFAERVFSFTVRVVVIGGLFVVL